MNVYIVVDLECISGITTGSMIRTGHSEWATRGRQMATAEVNAAIEGALAAGARRIVVQDGHDSGENLLREALHPAADLLSGGMAVTRYMPGLDRSFDAVFLIGFHARMGTAQAHFDHTISTACISEVCLNGAPIGEIGLYAAYAGMHAIPVALITGDRAGVAEAEALLGEVAGVSVKEGLGRFSAMVMAPELIRPRIREAAERGLRLPAKVLTPRTPTHLAIDFLRSAEADMAEMLPGSRRIGPRSVEYQHDDPATAFQAMEAMVNLAGIAASRWAQALYTTGNRVV
jgi:D-amino peptidase